MTHIFLEPKNSNDDLLNESAALAIGALAAVAVVGSVIFSKKSKLEEKQHFDRIIKEMKEAGSYSKFLANVEVDLIKFHNRSDLTKGMRLEKHPLGSSNTAFSAKMEGRMSSTTNTLEGTEVKNWLSDLEKSGTAFINSEEGKAYLNKKLADGFPKYQDVARFWNTDRKRLANKVAAMK